jgi:large subunit ribosomal protein L10
MPRPDKVTDVAELTENFRNSTAAVLTEYRGLTVAQLTQLRRSLGATTKYAVVKNTLSRIAIRDAGLQELESLLQGPSAIAFVKGDAVEAAKSLRDFARANPLLVIKGGVLDGKLITAAEISKIAELESREVLLSKVAGAANAALAKAAALFQAPLAQTARLVEALRAQVAESTPAAAAAPVDSDDTSATADAVTAEPSPPEASTPEVTAPEVSTPEVSTPVAEAPAAEAPTPDAEVPVTELPAAELPAEPTIEQTDVPADGAQA